MVKDISTSLFTSFLNVNTIAKQSQILSSQIIKHLICNIIIDCEREREEEYERLTELSMRKERHTMRAMMLSFGHSSCNWKNDANPFFMI